MPPFVLTVLKIVFLALLYFFVYRAFRLVVVGPARNRRGAAPAPAGPAKPGRERRSLLASWCCWTSKGTGRGPCPLDGLRCNIGRAEACQVQLPRHLRVDLPCPDLQPGRRVVRGGSGLDERDLPQPAPGDRAHRGARRRPGAGRQDHDGASPMRIRVGGPFGRGSRPTAQRGLLPGRAAPVRRGRRHGRAPGRGRGLLDALQALSGSDRARAVAGGPGGGRSRRPTGASWSAGEADRDLRGMGTTLTALRDRGGNGPTSPTSATLGPTCCARARCSS